MLFLVIAVVAAFAGAVADALKCHGYIGSAGGKYQEQLDCSHNGTIPAYCYSITSDAVYFHGCVVGATFKNDFENEMSMTANAFQKYIKILHNQLPADAHEFRGRIRQILNHRNMLRYAGNLTLIDVRQKICHKHFCNAATGANNFGSIIAVMASLISTIIILC